MTALATACASLAFLAVMFVPLERVFAARRDQPILRRGFVTDLAFFFGQHLVFAGLAASTLSLATRPLDAIEGLSSLRGAFAALPLAARVVLALGLGDLAAYAGHRLQHRVDLLWRIHAVHHTSEDVDWLAAHREHPLDGLYTQAVVNAPAVLLGLPLDGLLGLIAFRSLFAIFVHSNVALDLGPLRFLFGAPALHRAHHARDRDPGNYANLAPWIDVVFGTYRAPGTEAEALGLAEPHPKGYLGLLLYPWLPPSGVSGGVVASPAEPRRALVSAPRRARRRPGLALGSRRRIAGRRGSRRRRGSRSRGRCRDRRARWCLRDGARARARSAGSPLHNARSS